jgi:hypothetical protein
MPAPKGNTNALRHGLYARHFNEDQRTGLRRMAWDDFRHEEFAHRAVGAAIFKLLNALLSRGEVDVDQVSKLCNALMLNTSATNTSARTHAILNGQDEQIGDALSQALEDVPFDQEPDAET